MDSSAAVSEEAIVVDVPLRWELCKLEQLEPGFLLELSALPFF